MGNEAIEHLLRLKTRFVKEMEYHLDSLPDTALFLDPLTFFQHERRVERYKKTINRLEILLNNIKEVKMDNKTYMQTIGIPQQVIDEIMDIEMPESKHFPKELENEADEMFNGEQGF